MAMMNCDLSYMMPVQGTQKYWCVYKHMIMLHPHPLTLPIYVGISEFSEVSRMKDARQNTHWLKMTSAPGTQIVIQIITIFDNYPEAMNWLTNYIKTSTEPLDCNRYGYSLKGIRRPIVSSTGVTYDNQERAALALGVSQSAISQHLRGAMPSVKGQVLRYKTND